jgi:hypothetical protein
MLEFAVSPDLQSEDIPLTQNEKTISSGLKKVKKDKDKFK